MRKLQGEEGAGERKLEPLVMFGIWSFIPVRTEK
jgi:hypothetical protein